MKVLIIGSGGREHAIAKKLQQDIDQCDIYVLPGNGGISQQFACPEIQAEDISSVINYVLTNNIDYVIPSTEEPIVSGIIDALIGVGVCCFGPSKNAAIIEGSKWFSKEFMRRHAIPTAEYRLFDDYEMAKQYLQTCKYPKVIKADGLAKGKGVYIVRNVDQAIHALNSFMVDLQFGKAGERVVIEEYLEGHEVSVQLFTDGHDFVCLPSSMDYKKIGEKNVGLNTGGMGAISPNPFYSKDIEQICICNIIKPTLRGLEQEGRKYVGCLYIGLMLTADGPKVLEYNCRLGDPETEAILPLIESSVLEMMLWTNGKVPKPKIKLQNNVSCSVILASKGYPQAFKTGISLTIPSDVLQNVCLCGVKFSPNGLISASGRVLAVTTVAGTLLQAVEHCYAVIDKINPTEFYYRRDIGKTFC